MKVAFTSMPSCLKMIGPEKLAAVPGRIEVDHLAGEVLQRIDLRPDENVHLGGKQAQQVVDAAPGTRELRLVLEVVEHVAVDDGRIHAAQVEQVVDVVEGAARHDRQHPHVVAVIEHARELGSELQGRPFGATGREAHRPRVDPLLVRGFVERRGPRRGRRGATAVAAVGGAPRRCGGVCDCAWAASEPAEARIARPATARATRRIRHSPRFQAHRTPPCCGHIGVALPTRSHGLM